jgi:DNA-binding transcriptional MerR regulator
MEPNSRLFTIQQVSAQCGVSKSTLRFWEKKFQAHMFPDRSKGGQRRYSPEHVSVIALIKRLKADGLSLDEIDARISSGRKDTVMPPAPSLEHLAARIAELVKHEVNRYFESTASPPAQPLAPTPMEGDLMRIDESFQDGSPRGKHVRVR